MFAVVLGTLLLSEQGPMQTAQLVVLPLLEMVTSWCAFYQGTSAIGPIKLKILSFLWCNGVRLHYWMEEDNSVNGTMYIKHAKGRSEAIVSTHTGTSVCMLHQNCLLNFGTALEPSPSQISKLGNFCDFLKLTNINTNFMQWLAIHFFSCVYKLNAFTMNAF